MSDTAPLSVPLARRRFLATLGAGVLGASLPLRAQQAPPRAARIGFLAIRSRPASWDSDYYGGFVRGMQELGYVEGKNLVIEWRFADGQIDRLEDLAEGLVPLKVDAVVTTGTSATRAAQRALRNRTPIVMASSADPLTSGFVASLARPGGNITGLSRAQMDITPKYLELLRPVMPKLSKLAVLLQPDNEFYSPRLKSILAAARAARVRVHRIDARTPGEIDSAFKVMMHEEVEALIVPTDPFLIQQRHQIAGLALKHNLPSAYGVREHVEAGGLMSYGQNFTEIYRRAAMYVDRILRGAKPSELPVEQPSRFEFALNLRTAKALGLVIPPDMAASADLLVE